MPHTQPDHEQDTWAKTICLLVLGFFLHALPWSAFAQPPLPAEGQLLLRMQGSNTIGAKLGPALAKGLMQEQGFKDISLQPAAENEVLAAAFTTDGRRVSMAVAAHGSGTGFVSLLDGSAELAASSRPIKATEQHTLQAFGDMRSRDAEHVIAIDGLAIVVHPGNPLSALSTQQVAQLFAGEVTDWSQLGGPSGTVNLYARDDNSGTYDTFKELVLTAQGKALNARAKRFESSDELSDAVSRDPLAIGFIGLPYIKQTKALAIADGDSVAMYPSRDLIATEDYPLSRRLFLYLKPGEDNAWARALVSFAQGPQGQAIVAQSGFIAQTVEASAVKAGDKMPEDYRALAQQARRLNVNFRFKQGSATLDNKAQYDVERVVQYLQQHDKLYRKVVLVGFGDPKEDPARAQLLSRLRAQMVSIALGAGGVMPKATLGFGDELPVAANSVDEGRKKNQRVEVWVY